MTHEGETKNKKKKHFMLCVVCEPVLCMCGRVQMVLLRVYECYLH